MTKSTKKLTNSGETKKGVMERFLNLLAEGDRVKEDMKELTAEIKSREADLGVSVKQVKAAVALYRKGARDKAAEMERTMAFLIEAGMVEEAADAALS